MAMVYVATPLEGSPDFVLQWEMISLTKEPESVG